MEEKRECGINEMETGELLAAGLLTAEGECLEKLYGIPVLGVIPRGPGKKSWFRRRKSTANTAEQKQTEDDFNG